MFDKINFVQGIPNEKYIKDLIQIDKEVYGEEPTSTMYSWALSLSRFYTLFLKNDVAIGYALILPLNKEGYEKLKSGEIGENNLDLKYIVSMENAYKIYVSSVAVLPSINRFLKGRFLKHLQKSSQKLEKPLFAVTISKEGDNVARKIFSLKNNYPYTGNKFKGLKGYKPQFYE